MDPINLGSRTLLSNGPSIPNPGMQGTFDPESMDLMDLGSQFWGSVSTPPPAPNPLQRMYALKNRKTC